MKKDNYELIKSSQKKTLVRRDSIIRTGTGRYEQEKQAQLGNCIATEKGLLKKEDYDHI